MISDGERITGFFHFGEDAFLLKQGFEFASPVNDDVMEKIEISKIMHGVYGEKSEGDNIYSFNYGPSAGGLVETINFKIYTYGERILSVIAKPDYKRRDIILRAKSLRDAQFIMERYNGFHSFSYSTLFVRAVETLRGIVPSPEDVSTRVILLETERIISHIFKTVRLCESASQNIAAYWLMSLRERLMRLLGEVVGHRYLFGVNRIGGLTRNIDTHKLQKGIEDIVKEYRVLLKGLYSSRIFIDRLTKTCITPSVPMSGPSLRASDINFDYREIDPYYSDIPVKPQTERDSDALARFLVFSAEVDSSLEIIRNIRPVVLEKGEDIGENNIPVFAIETPSGDAQLVLKIEQDRIVQNYIRTPSMLNLEAFCMGIKGNVVTDIPFAFETFGIWVSEIGGIS